RVWHCRYQACSFTGHRDVVGSVNMHALAFGQRIDCPAQVTYQRPGPLRAQRGNKQPALVVASRHVVVARTRATSDKLKRRLAAGVVLVSRNLNHSSGEEASQEADYRSAAAKKLILFTGLRVSRYTSSIPAEAPWLRPWGVSTPSSSLRNRRQDA